MPFGSWFAKASRAARTASIAASWRLIRALSAADCSASISSSDVDILLYWRLRLSKSWLLRLWRGACTSCAIGPEGRSRRLFALVVASRGGANPTGVNGAATVLSTAVLLLTSGEDVTAGCEAAAFARAEGDTVTFCLQEWLAITVSGRTSVQEPVTYFRSRGSSLHVSRPYSSSRKRL